MGWIGSNSELMNYLRVVDADQDEDGKFIVRGNIVSFMGAGDEFVIDDSAQYFVGGNPAQLAAGLNSTSYGLKIKVI